MCDLANVCADDGDGKQVRTEFAQTDVGREEIEALHTMNNEGRISFSASIVVKGKVNKNAFGVYHDNGSKYAAKKSKMVIKGDRRGDPELLAIALAHEGMHAVQHKYGVAYSDADAVFAEHFARSAVSGSKYKYRDMSYIMNDYDSRPDYGPGYCSTLPGLGDFYLAYGNAWVNQGQAPWSKKINERRADKYPHDNDHWFDIKSKDDEFIPGWRDEMSKFTIDAWLGRTK